MVISESIREAIRAAIEKSGSSLSFSRSIGVSHTTVSFWLNGRTRKINATVWQNLLPRIQEFLPDGSLPYPSAPAAAVPAGHFLHERPAPWYGGAGTAQNVSVPLLHLNDFADFDPQIDSIEEIIREKSTGSVMFTSFVQPGYFAVEVDRKHAGFFAEGTRLLLRGQDAPCDGDTVLVKLRNKRDFLFALFTRKGDGIELAPLQKGGRKRTIPRNSFHKVCRWIVPVREAVQTF